MSAKEGSYRFSLFEVPDHVDGGSTLDHLFFREFGTAEPDLDIDFNQIRPYVVTHLLAECAQDKNGGKLNPLIFWNLSISDRIECLLILASMGGKSELWVQCKCLKESCGQSMMLDLQLQALLDLQHQTRNSAYVTVAIGNEMLRIRKPTGKDQLEWLTKSFVNENAATKEMIRSLLAVEREITDSCISLINEAMEQFDPLVNFSCAASCPHCGWEGRYALDLEIVALQELYETQIGLLETVHRLASHYHWTEGQILSIEPWRRSAYLSMIEKGAFH